MHQDKDLGYPVGFHTLLGDATLRVKSGAPAGAGPLQLESADKLERCPQAKGEHHRWDPGGRCGSDTEKVLDGDLAVI